MPSATSNVSTNATSLYKNRLEATLSQLDELRAAVLGFDEAVQHAERETGQPINYSHTGTLWHVGQQLDDLLRFLG